MHHNLFPLLVSSASGDHNLCQDKKGTPEVVGRLEGIPEAASVGSLVLEKSVAALHTGFQKSLVVLPSVPDISGCDVAVDMEFVAQFLEAVYFYG